MDIRCMHPSCSVMDGIYGYARRVDMPKYALKLSVKQVDFDGIRGYRICPVYVGVAVLVSRALIVGRYPVGASDAT